MEELSRGSSKENDILGKHVLLTFGKLAEFLEDREIWKAMAKKEKEKEKKKHLETLEERMSLQKVTQLLEQHLQ